VALEPTTPVFERTKTVHAKIRESLEIKNRHISSEQLAASEELSKMEFVSQLSILVRLTLAYYTLKTYEGPNV
jgi:hypothetical protein